MSDVTTVGDKVKLKKDNVVGTVRFIGEIKGKQGIYYGIELDDKYKLKGKNDGSANRICYFKCAKKGGVFVKKSGIVKTNSKNNQSVPRVTVGMKVDCTKAKCKGTIKFIGVPYSTKKTGIFYGIELEKQKGTSNGTVKDRYYFRCKNKYGIFLKEEEFSCHQQKLIKTTGKKSPRLPRMKSTKSPKTLALSRKKSKTKIEDIANIIDEKHQNDHESDDIETDEKTLTEMNGYIEFDIVENGIKRLKELFVYKDNQIRKLGGNPTDNPTENIPNSPENIPNGTGCESKEMQDSLKNKEDEIATQKRLYQELETKYKTEVESLKMLLEEQKQINKQLMEKTETFEKETQTEQQIIEDVKSNDSETESAEEVVKKPAKIILDEHIDCLMSGYFRELYTCTDDDDDDINEDVFDKIFDICLMYFFIAPLFTNTHSKHASMSEKGTRFISSGVDNIDICYPSDEAFKNGIHMWRLFCIDCTFKDIDEQNKNVAYAIGVSTDFMNCDRGIDGLQNSIYYDGNSGIISKYFKEKICDNKSKWGKGDEIILRLDCDNAKIMFYKNGQDIGVYDIDAKGKMYYLIVQLNSSQGYDFKLTQYF